MTEKKKTTKQERAKRDQILRAAADLCLPAARGCEREGFVTTGFTIKADGNMTSMTLKERPSTLAESIAIAKAKGKLAGRAKEAIAVNGRRLAVAKKGGEGRAAKQAPKLKRLLDLLFDDGVTTAPELKKRAKKGLHGLKLSGGFLLLTDRQGKLLPGEKLSWETVKDRLKARRSKARRETGEK
jgi:hypothetical protein